MELKEKIADGLVKAGDTLKRNSWRELIGRQYGLLAILGAVVIGVTLPTLLVCWRAMGTIWVSAPDGEYVKSNILRIGEGWLLLVWIATFTCGPGAVLLGLFIYWLARRENVQARGAIVLSAIVAFFNYPGWFSLYLLQQQPHALPRVICLFLVTGASCGWWIQWQARRYREPEQPIFPRFSLQTLLLLLIGWGWLMALFAPR